MKEKIPLQPQVKVQTQKNKIQNKRNKKFGKSDEREVLKKNASFLIYNSEALFNFPRV